jgi:hypothetical protein
MGRNFKRQELYDLVWSRPAGEVAGTAGVSGVALAKACREQTFRSRRVANGQNSGRLALHSKLPFRHASPEVLTKWE